MDDRINEFLRYKKKIPKLIPLYGHRFVVSDKNTNYPIISVYQTDVIYYGRNLLDYFEHEFNHVDNISNTLNVKEIPFWSKIIDL